MDIYVSATVVIVGLILLLTGDLEATLMAGVVFSLGGFGYRVRLGEESRAVIADALFVVALMPIGWWAAKEFLSIVEPNRPIDRN